MKNSWRYRILIALVVAMVLTACSGIGPRTATIDGSDPATNTRITPINMWAAYNPRGAKVGEVQDGQTVTVLQQVDQAAYIRTAEGVQGWVGIGFIKELRPAGSTPQDLAP